MRYALVVCWLLCVFALGCARKEEAAKGVSLPSKEVEFKRSKGKMVTDELPDIPAR